jgi:acetate kinase
VVDGDTGGTLESGLVDRIGTPACTLKWKGAGGEVLEDLPGGGVEAATLRLAELACGGGPVEAVGHRVVHGAEWFNAPALINRDVLHKIEECSVFAPLHNPANAAGIRAAMDYLPDLPHVAVFDTAFHATMPPRAFRYALPEEAYREDGIRRYGFHGTSHQYISGVASEWLDEQGVERPHRVVTLHLGNGCSAAAVLDGRSVDTSMGFTPLEGLVMGTRTGDLDPAIVSALMGRRNWSREEVDAYLNKRSGLLGLSGVSADMRDIEKARNEGHAGAALAFDIFCYRIVKYVGSYISVLGGLDALVFSGGIGENSSTVRREVLSQLKWCGLIADPSANEAEPGAVARVTEAAGRPVALVVRTDEEGLIARQAAHLARQGWE